MKENVWHIGNLLQSFFDDYMIRQRCLSPNTISSYRDTWSLFLRFMQVKYRKAPSKFMVSDLNAGDVLAFLDDIETSRGNAAQTRNVRRAAIRCAVNYALVREPTLPAATHRIMAIPEKKAGRRILGFLEQPEIDALLAVSDMTSWSGRRDRILLETMYNTGARVSEMTAAKVSDTQLETTIGRILLHGKGRKERTLPLWKETTRHLRAWIAEECNGADAPLFPNKNGGFLTRSSVDKRLKKMVNAATVQCPSLGRLSISSHTIRHTTAMHLLDAGVEITSVSMWLGHESIETTNIYLTSSLERKEKALSTLQAPGTKALRFIAKDDLLAYLENL